MRKLLRWLLLKPVLWATKKFSSKPDRTRIGQALDKLYKDTRGQQTKKGIVLPFELSAGRFIIFSDQHKGARDGADDFTLAAPNYLAALEYYDQKDFTLICLGDSEELWENTLGKVKEFNTETFDAEKKFLTRKAFVKVLGNHDLYWGNDPFAWWQLRKIYGEDVPIYEAVILGTTISDKEFRIFCTHGHQGDAQSDGNWFSKFFVARIWAPVQGYLRVNPNTPAFNNEKKTLHNEIMYEWSSRQTDAILITGHTHQPVFQSLTEVERLYRTLQYAQSQKNDKGIQETEAAIRKIEKHFTAVSIDYLTMRPTYFNSGCCCFSDGDITGIEIDEGCIRLIKWTLDAKSPQRKVLEEMKLSALIKLI